MEKITGFIKRRRVIIFLALVILALLVGNLLNKNDKSPQGPPLRPGVSYKDLVPGFSSKGDVIDKMGKPVSEEPSGVNVIYGYKSTSPTRLHEMSIANDTLVFIKEIVSVNDTERISDITSPHGDAPNVLYGPASMNGFNLYVYPDIGLAYLGNPNGEGVILEIWYFAPTTINDFKRIWAPQYGDTYSPKTQY